MRSRTFFIALAVLAAAAPIAAHPQQRDDSVTITGPAPRRIVGSLFRLRGSTTDPARPFRNLFGSPAIVSPVDSYPDLCQGDFFPPCDPHGECSIDSYICEVNPRTGIAQSTWLMFCPSCQAFDE